jgi:hypothetical protein
MNDEQFKNYFLEWAENNNIIISTKKDMLENRFRPILPVHCDTLEMPKRPIVYRPAADPTDESKANNLDYSFDDIDEFSERVKAHDLRLEPVEKPYSINPVRWDRDLEEEERQKFIEDMQRQGWVLAITESNELPEVDLMAEVRLACKGV